MRGGPGWHAQLAGELVERCEDPCERGTGSRAVLVAVPPGRGVTTALGHLAAAADGDDVPVTLAKAATRHRITQFLGLDRFCGMTQLGLGVAGLSISGPPAAVGFPLAGDAAAGVGTAWGDSPWTAGAVRCSWSQR